MPFVNQYAPPSLVYANNIYVLCTMDMNNDPTCFNSKDGENWNNFLYVHLYVFQSVAASVAFDGDSFFVATPNNTNVNVATFVLMIEGTVHLAI